MPMTSFLPLARIFSTATIRGTTSTAAASPYFDSLQFADSVESVRKLDNQTVEFSPQAAGRHRSSGIWPPTMRQLPLPNMPPA